MKNVFKVFGIIALLAVMVTVTGCATSTSIGGASGPHGLFTGNGASANATSSGTEIGSYTVILGLVDTGYPAFAAAVLKAEAERKIVTSVTKTYFFVVTITTAYAK